MRYVYVVEVDLSKYFDTLNHKLLMNLLRRKVKDKRVFALVKKHLKSGVMEDGFLFKTEKGSPQVRPFSPLLASTYLNEFDWEMKTRGVKVISPADEIVVFAKSLRAAKRLLESSRIFLEDRLKLRLNREKSKALSIYSSQFKFLGFRIGKNKDGVLIQAHKKSLLKAKRRLKQITRRNRGRNVRQVMQEIETYIRGWLGYFYIASMRRTLMSWNQWL